MWSRSGYHGLGAAGMEKKKCNAELETKDVSVMETYRNHKSMTLSEFREKRKEN